MIERQVVVLGRLAEVGLDIAEALGRQAAAKPADDGAPAPVALDDIALAYDRVARAVRRTIALQSERVEALRGLGAAPSAGGSADDRSQADGRKQAIARIVRRLANKQHRPDYSDRVGREARDWLEDENIYGDILAHPVSEIIDWICRDLGLSPDWAQLAEEAWAQDELESEAVGYPLKGGQVLALRPRPPPPAAPPVPPHALSSG